MTGLLAPVKMEKLIRRTQGMDSEAGEAMAELLTLVAELNNPTLEHAVLRLQAEMLAMQDEVSQLRQERSNAAKTVKDLAEQMRALRKVVEKG